MIDCDRSIYKITSKRGEGATVSPPRRGLASRLRLGQRSGTQDCSSWLARGSTRGSWKPACGVDGVRGRQRQQSLACVAEVREADARVPRVGGLDTDVQRVQEWDTVLRLERGRVRHGADPGPARPAAVEPELASCVRVQRSQTRNDCFIRASFPSDRCKRHGEHGVLHGTPLARPS